MYLTKDQLRQKLNAAPPGTTPSGIIAALRNQGVRMEGDPTPLPVQSPFKGVPILGPASQDATQNIQNASDAISKYSAGQQGVIPTAMTVTGNAASALLQPVTHASSALFAPAAWASNKIMEGSAAAGQALANTSIGQPIAKAVWDFFDPKTNALTRGMQQQADFLGSPQAAPYVEGAKALGQAGMDALQAYGAAKVLSPSVDAVRPTMNAATNINEAAIKPTVQSLSMRLMGTTPAQEYSAAIKQGVEKGIKPKFVGAMRSSPTALQDYTAKAEDAVTHILNNKSNLQYVDETGNIASEAHAPRNLSEFAQAISQTKKSLFDEYSSLSQAATGKGVKINLHDIVDKLLSYADNPVKQLADKSKTEYAITKADQLMKQGSLDPTQTENLIKELNQGLAKTYSDKSAKGVSEVDLSIANALREQLDSAIQSATGKQYQPLKDAYGSLKTIEKDVGQTALTAARQNMKGLSDMTDIFTGGDILAGVFTQNPALVLKGLAGKGISSWYKSINSPNTNIMRMFNRANSIFGRVHDTTLPTTSLGSTQLPTQPLGQGENATLPSTLPVNPTNIK